MPLFLTDGGAKKRVESTKACSKKICTSEAEIAEEIGRTTSFGDNGLFSCLGK